MSAAMATASRPRNSWRRLASTVSPTVLRAPTGGTAASAFSRVTCCYSVDVPAMSGATFTGTMSRATVAASTRAIRLTTKAR